MGKWTIIRVYEVPADSQIQAIDRMLEALVLGVERDFYVKDILRAPEAPPGTGVTVSLEPPRGWLSILREQLVGVRKQTKR